MYKLIYDIYIYIFTKKLVFHILMFKFQKEESSNKKITNVFFDNYFFKLLFNNYLIITFNNYFKTIF